MRHRGLLVGSIVLFVVGVSGLVAMAALDGTRERLSTGMDAMFIEHMIPHHQDAIDMADMALTRSQRSEIRELARDIKGSQTEEIGQMRSWYREWYGREVRDERRGMMGRDMTDLDALERADDFDREFLEQMIPHHRMAVMMATMAMSAGGRPQLRRFAESMRREQGREIDLMEDWYRQWYDR